MIERNDYPNAKISHETRLPHPEYLDGQKDREDGVRYWFEEIKIRFEFKTKAEQEDFAERLAADGVTLEICATDSSL